MTRPLLGRTPRGAAVARLGLGGWLALAGAPGLGAFPAWVLREPSPPTDGARVGGGGAGVAGAGLATLPVAAASRESTGVLLAAKGTGIAAATTTLGGAEAINTRALSRSPSGSGEGGDRSRACMPRTIPGYTDSSDSGQPASRETAAAGWRERARLLVKRVAGGASESSGAEGVLAAVGATVPGTVEPQEVSLYKPQVGLCPPFALVVSLIRCSLALCIFSRRSLLSPSSPFFNRNVASP